MEEETRSRGEGIPLGSAQPQQRTRKPVPQGGDEVPSRDTDRQWYDQAQGSGERMRATPCAGRSRRQTPLPSHSIWSVRPAGGSVSRGLFITDVETTGKGTTECKVPVPP